MINSKDRTTINIRSECKDAIDSQNEDTGFNLTDYYTYVLLGMCYMTPTMFWYILANGLVAANLIKSGVEPDMKRVSSMAEEVIENLKASIEKDNNDEIG